MKREQRRFSDCCTCGRSIQLFLLPRLQVRARRLLIALDLLKGDRHLPSEFFRVLCLCFSFHLLSQASEGKCWWDYNFFLLENREGVGQ